MRVAAVDVSAGTRALTDAFTGGSKMRERLQVIVFQVSNALMSRFTPAYTVLGASQTVIDLGVYECIWKAV